MHRLSQLKELSNILKHYKTRSEFATKYGFHYYKVTEAIDDGRIAVHSVDGKLYINVEEALSVLSPRKRKAKVDLF